MMPHPSSPMAPKYWMHETGGELGPAVRRYIEGEELSVRDLSLIRDYLLQWVGSPAWDQNPDATDLGRRRLFKLRFSVYEARTKDQIDACIHMAVDMGMDPL